MQFKNAHRSITCEWQVIKHKVYNEQQAAKKRLQNRLHYCRLYVNMLPVLKWTFGICSW